MLEPICRRRCYRALVAVAPLVLGACAEAVPVAEGFVELTAAAAPGTTCAAPGELRLEGMAGSALLVIPGTELCGSPRRHELPPGSYTLSWRSAALTDALERLDSSPLSGPAVVSLLPGQLTRLRVQLEPPGMDPGATAASNAGAGSVDPPACSHGAAPSGAS